MKNKLVKELIKFPSKHRFGICVTLIILLSIILRFYNYENRWALAHDQARDALIAREALHQHKIPILGPFSQAGSFVMGPIWYWLVMAATAVYPDFILTPWIVLTLSFIFVVYLMILIGREIEGRLFGIILGIITAVSTSQVAQSSNLTNPSGIAIFSVLTVYFSIKYIKTGKNLFLFLFPFFIAISINIHLQAIGLLAIIPVILIIKRPHLKQLIYLVLGFIIPFIPLIIFDLNNNFYNIRSIIDYYLYGQYKIYFPNRWLIYLFTFWPSAWAHIIGGEAIVTYLIIFFLALTLVYQLAKNKLNKQTIFIILTLFIMVVFLRFYRGEKFPSYLLFINPFILILTSITVYWLIKFNKVIGFTMLLIILFFTMSKNLNIINGSINNTYIYVRGWSNNLTKKFPKEKFALYGYKYEDRNKSLLISLSLYLDSQNKIDDNGRQIGIILATDNIFNYPRVYENKRDWEILDLSRVDKKILSENQWFFINPSEIYKATQEWFAGKKL